MNTINIDRLQGLLKRKRQNQHQQRLPRMPARITYSTQDVNKMNLHSVNIQVLISNLNHPIL